MNSLLRITGTAAKQLLGALFLFSALAKFATIEKFDVYIFSYGFFSLNLSILAGWAVVCTELLLGMALISNRHHRWVMLANTLMLVGFTLFLGYAYLSGRTDNCHCLGEMLPFNPIQSMLKNAVLLLVSLFAWRFADRDWRPRWWLVLLMVLIPSALFALGAFCGWTPMTRIDFEYAMILAASVSAATVIVSLPFARRWWVQVLAALTPYVAVMILSTWVALFSRDGSTAFDRQLFGELISDKGVLAEENLDEGRRVVCFFSPSCPYCRMAAEKLTLIQHRHQLPADRITLVFPGDSLGNYDSFFEAAHADAYYQTVLNPDDYLRLTYGMLPVVALVEDGKVLATFTHSDLSEKELTAFLKEQ